MKFDGALVAVFVRPSAAPRLTKEVPMRRFTLLAAVVLMGISLFVPTVAATSVKVARATTVTVKALEFKFILSKTVVPHGTVVFKVTNAGKLPHDFKIAGKKTRLLSPHQTTTLRVAFRKAGRYPYLCTVPGHAAAGMRGVLTVK
jgi:uncharacterized cupredoxin-like copper-binding protein